jgi:YggT family protein
MREVLCWLVFAYILAIVVRMVLSWFPSSGGLATDAERLLRRVTEPALGPLRRAIPPVGALDLSPLILLLFLQIVVMRIVLGCAGPI